MDFDGIYLDYNATTPVDPRVCERMDEVARSFFGNPSSSHGPGRRAAEILDQARARVAELLGGRPEEICFTAGGSESDNLALKGVVLPCLCRGEKPHVIISRVEHPAVDQSCHWLEAVGAEVTRLPVAADGTLDPAAVAAALRDDTVMVSLMLANNETGVIFPVAEISKLTRERGIIFHTDAVQAFGKIPIDVNLLQVDLLSVSGHKIYAPKGVGALWIRDGVELTPLIHGGGQEDGRRAGTENLVGIAAFGRACEILGTEMEFEGERIRVLRDGLENELAARLGQELIFHGHRRLRVPNTSSLSVPYLDSEALLTYLDLENISVSAGSACSSSEHQGSPVLQAMGVSPDLARGALRISLGRWTDQAQIDTFIEKFVAVVRRLWAISPLRKRVASPDSAE